MSGKSDFLFAQPTLWEGMGRLLDFGGFLSMYNTSRSGAEADAIANAMDWKAVYSDLEEAYNGYKNSVKDAPAEEQLTVGSRA